MRTGPTKVTWLVGAVLVLLAGRPLAAREGSPGLVGRWQLNEKESEDPQAKFRPLRPGEDPRQAGAESQEGTARGGEGRGRRPRDEARRPGTPGASDPAAKLDAPPGLTEFLEPPRTLTITGTEAELVLDDGKGTPLRLTIDGVEKKEGPVAYTARWEGSSLVVDKKNEHGARLTTRYSLMPGQKKLEVYARLAGKEGRAVTLRRVYDGTEATP